MVNGLNLPMYVIGGGLAAAWDAFSPSMFRGIASALDGVRGHCANHRMLAQQVRGQLLPGRCWGVMQDCTERQDCRLGTSSSPSTSYQPWLLNCCLFHHFLEGIEENAILFRRADRYPDRRGRAPRAKWSNDDSFLLQAFGNCSRIFAQFAINEVRPGRAPRDIRAATCHHHPLRLLLRCFRPLCECGLHLRGRLAPPPAPVPTPRMWCASGRNMTSVRSGQFRIPRGLQPVRALSRTCAVRPRCGPDEHSRATANIRRRDVRRNCWAKS